MFSPLCCRRGNETTHVTSGHGIDGSTCSSAGVFPTTSVGGAARTPAPADETAAANAASTVSGTVPSATPLREAVGARESSAGTASSDEVAEAAPLTGNTAVPVLSVARAARAPGSADDRLVPGSSSGSSSSRSSNDNARKDNSGNSSSRSSNDNARKDNSGNSSSRSSNDNARKDNSWRDATVLERCCAPLIRGSDAYDV